MFKIHDIFRPGKCGKFSHGSTVAELPDGNIMAAWYSGSYEKSPDVGIYYSIFNRKNESWSDPLLLEKESNDKSEGNPVLYYDDENSRLWLFWATMDRAGKKFMPGGWSTCRIKCKHSDDGGKTWTSPRYLTRTWGRMTRNKPLRMSNGDVILPVYSEWLGYKANFFIFPGEEFARGSKKTRYIKIGPIRGGILQPTVVETERGHIFALLRTSKRGKFAGKIARADSYDYGRSWTRARTIDLPNPNSACDMVKLKSGNIALAFNNSPEFRNPLSVALSEDGGNTWKYIRNIVSLDGARFGYPAIIQASDGSIFCTYTNDRGINIRCAVFDEKWIRTGE